MAEYRYLAEPHPHWLDFPKNLPPDTQIDRMSRDHLPIKPQDGLTIDELDDQVFTVDKSQSIVLRRYQQSGPRNSFPLFIYIHGGGFVTGGLETDDKLCRQVAAALKVVVLSVEYRLAPEHQFPHGFEDCLQVLKWVILPSTEKSLNIDLSQGFLLGGTSAGGNFTSALAHTMIEQGLSPRPSGLLFMASSFCHPDVRPEQYRERILSVDEITDAPGLTASSIRYFAKKYGAPPEDKRYSPLLHTSRKGLAKKAFFQICGWDPRRDEAILYEKLLQQDNIETRSEIYKGLPHGFWTSCPGLEESLGAMKDTVEGVNWLLE